MKLRLVDAIESWEPHQAIRGRKVVSFEEYMIRRHGGRTEQLPESLALGSMIELAAWLTILSSDFTQIALPCEFGQVHFLSTPGPGRRMDLLLTRRPGAETVVLDGQGLVAGTAVLEVEDLRMSLHPLAGFYDPKDLRVLFSEIHRPVREVLP
jgi:hypothetical protein